MMKYQKILKINKKYQKLLDKSILHLEEVCKEYDKLKDENKKMKSIIDLQKKWIQTLEEE